MKKFFSLLCAFAVIFSVSAATPVLSKKDFDEKVANKQIRVQKPFQSMELPAKNVLGIKNLNTVARAPQAKKDVTFSIAISDIKPLGAKIVVTPSDNSATYYWSVYEAADVAGKSDADLAALIQDDLDYYILMYEYFYGETYTYADFLVQGKDSSKLSSLDSETDYTVVAIALDANCAAASVSARENFSTPAVVIPAGGDFEMTSVAESFYASGNDVWVRLYDEEGNTFRFDIVLPEGQEALVSGHTYTLDSMLANYSYATYQGVKLTYASASLVKTIAANGDYDINAQFADTLGNTWNLHYQYVKPTKTRGETLIISGLKLGVWDGGWQLYGYSSDSTVYVSIAADADDITGGYAGADLDEDYTYVVTDIDAANQTYKFFNLIDADLDVSFNEADSTILVTGLLLAQNDDDETDVPEFTLSLSGRIPAPEMSDMTFAIAADANGITVTPSKLDEAWDWFVVSEAVFQSYGADYIAEAIFSNYGNSYAEPGVRTFAWDDEELVYYCSDDNDEIVPGNYYIVVWGAGDANVTTEAASFAFYFPYAQGIENIELTEKAQKVVVDGAVYIVRDNKLFNLQGAQVR